MKTLSYLTMLISGVLICGSCSKTDTLDQPRDPLRYNVYFELFTTDSSIFDEGNVEISEPMEMLDGAFIYPGDEIRWHFMKVDTLLSGALNRTIFEPIVFSGWSSEWNFSGKSEWEQNTYYLMRYYGDSVDTLQIKENTIVEPYRQEFKFFLNEEPIKEIIITEEGRSIEEPWILMIQK